MTHVINILHWLDEHGAPVPALRKRVLRIARLIEYGGPLELGHARITLVECTRRVERRPCEVVKKDAGTLEAFCEMCHREHLLISGWEDTEWADGPMEPLTPEDLQAPLAQLN